MRMKETDCSGIRPLQLPRARRGMTLLVVLALGLPSAVAQESVPGGFSTPRQQDAVAVTHSNNHNDPTRIVAIRLEGIDSELATELASGLRQRVGSLPSRQLLADDTEALLQSGQFGRVTPRWEQSPAGWILVYELSPRAPELVFRGQSESSSAAGHSPPSSTSRPRAPSLPRAPEDFEEQPAATSPVTLEDPLVDVRVEGNVTIPVSEIQRFVKVRPGRNATQQMIKDDVDALVRTRWFVSVEPVISRTTEGLVLTYRVLERPIVRNVEYRGANKMKKDKLAALTNLKVGSPYDVSINRECARRIEELYHEKGFAFATVELEKGNDKDDREVVFLIEEGPKVQVVAVDYRGNQFFSKPVLNLKLQTKKRIVWTFGGKYDPATIPNDKASLTAYYRGLGFFDMTIDHELKFNQDRSHVTIVYNIEEGPRYKIRNVEFLGNDVIPTEMLQEGHTIRSGEFFTERKLAADVDKMREKYGTLGRLFAKVDAVPRFTEEPGVVDILYRIDEDKVYRVREVNVHIAGDHPHSRTNLVRNISLIQPGDLADPRKIQRTKTRLAGSGYFENTPDLAPRLEISRVEDPGWLQITGPDLARGQAEPTERVVATPPATTNRVAKPPTSSAPASITPTQPQSDPNSQTVRESNAAGFVPLMSLPPTPQTPAQTNTRAVDDEILRTADAVIRGQGDVLLAQSRGPIQEPQNFLWDNSPQGDPLGRAIRDPDPNLWQSLPPPEFIDIDAYLAEARTGRLMFGVGVNSDAGVIGNIVLSENNFDLFRPPTSWEDIWNGTAWRGAGQRFRIEALPGSEVSRYLVDWQNPYFMDTDINLGVSGFYYTRFFRFWDEQRVGGRINLGRQFTQTWSGSVALRLENVSIGDEYQPAPQSLADAVGDNFLSTVRAGLSHDTRDAAFLPTSGHFVEFAVEQAFAEFNYTRFDVEGRQYFTTYQRPDGGGKHVVNLHGNFGWTSSSTPIFEKFYAGGFQSFRGFAFRGISPQENGVEVGGQFMLLGSAEYQMPILANEMLKVVAFSDFGTVEPDVTFDNFRVAVGAGLRIQVPGMGPVPVALDWAVPIKKASFDREQLFSFYIGINR